MIETERLILSKPTLAEFEPYYAMLQDPQVYRFLGNTDLPRPEAWTRFMRSAGHWALYGYGLFSIREKATQRYIGEAGIMHFQRDLGADFDPYPEGAWVLASAGHGKGYATEAAQAAFDWFFALKGQQRSVCIIDPDNAGSIRVAEKLGFRAIGQRAYRDKPINVYERPATAGP